MNAHHYTSTVEETVALALHSGTDLNCGDFYLKYTQQALDNKTIVEADIDRALGRTFNVLVRLGYFDPPEQQPYRKLSKDDVDTPAARQLSLEAASQGIVLLKNTNKALPLSISQLQNKKIALIGPTADATSLMQSNYYGRAPFLIDPVTGFRGLVEGKQRTRNFLFIGLVFQVIPSMFHLPMVVTYPTAIRAVSQLLFN